VRVLILDNDRGMRELSGAVLMDFHLGGGHSGAAVARRWAAEGRLPPFWLVTGTPEDEEVRALADLPQLRAVVGKPFSLLAFAREVKISLTAPPADPAPAEPSPALPAEALPAEPILAVPTPLPAEPMPPSAPLE
jgi:hypothetical protein